MGVSIIAHNTDHTEMFRMVGLGEASLDWFKLWLEEIQLESHKIGFDEGHQEGYDSGISDNLHD